MRIFRLYNILISRLLLGQLVKIGVGLRVGGIDRFESLQRVNGFLHTLFDIAPYCFLCVKLRLLG